MAIKKSGNNPLGNITVPSVAAQMGQGSAPQKTEAQNAHAVQNPPKSKMPIGDTATTTPAPKPEAAPSAPAATPMRRPGREAKPLIDGVAEVYIGVKIPEPLSRRIRVQAATNGIEIKRFVGQILLNYMDEHYPENI